MDKTYNLNGSYKPTLKRYADMEGPDFYPTPSWATVALIDNEDFSPNVWECACGDGAISRVLVKAGFNVRSSDLYDRGYGDSGVDFLYQEVKHDNIITNPPFHSAESFVEKCHDLAQEKFALLLRLAFLEGANRSRTIFHKIPPARVWVFSERITFYPKGVVASGSGTTAYAWFVWDKNHKNATELAWIRPGYKKEYK